MFFFKVLLKKRLRRLGVSWLGFKSWYAAKQPAPALWGKRNLKRRKKRKKKKKIPRFGKGQYEGVWSRAKSKRIFH